jgi:hypothetical protein
MFVVIRGIFIREFREFRESAVQYGRPNPPTP